METSINKKNGRVYLLDEIRGFAILCMVVYHAMYQLKFGFGVNVPIFFEAWFDIIRDFFAGMFIFISGIMCRYSHDNTKRGAKCFLLGMIITFVMPFFSDYGITFGILHLLGISMMVYGVLQGALERIPAALGLILFAAIAAFTWNAQYGFLGFGGALKWEFPADVMSISELAPLGIIDGTYQASDYFPIMPWFFIFLSGSYMGYWFKNGSMPKCFYKPHCNWLAAVGRVTVWIYILHAPLILGIFTLIFR